MAGEQKGEVFEILTFHALRKIGYRQGRTMFWGVAPEGFSIDPDFVIGSLTEPTHWCLLTSNSSPKEFDKKFWRNLGEIFEVKRSFEKPPKIVNLVFQAQQMKGMQAALARLCDADLRVEHTAYGAALIQFVERLLPTLPKTKEDRIWHVEEQIEGDANASKAFGLYCLDLKSALRKKDASIEDLWRLIKQPEFQSNKREAKRTFVRRGLAKLLLFDRTSRTLIYDQVAGRKLAGKLPRFAVDLGIARHSLRGPIIADNDIVSAVTTLGPESCDRLVKLSYEERKDHWDKWIQELTKPSVVQYNSYILEHRDALVTSEGMLRHLESHSPNGYKWLFWHVLELLKVREDKKQGYGFAVLAQDVGYTKGISEGYKLLADWANGSTKTRLPPKMLGDVARALALRIRDIPPNEVAEASARMAGEFHENLIEQKFCTYWLFQPLKELIITTLNAHGVRFSVFERHPTFIGELMDTPKLITTPMILAKETLIHWKSAYDQGRNHKTKELSGRSPALRLSFSEGEFRERRGVKKLVLLVDGTFTEKQLSTMQRAGWDEIFYPDEMDKLAAAIV